MMKTKHAKQRWVVKVGSALLTNDGYGLDVELIKTWVEQLATLHQLGVEIILVSSGSVAEGAVRLGFNHRPTAINELQAAASVGQMGLIQTYESAFKTYSIQTAQVLLTRDDLASRKRYLNARSTLMTLLSYGVISVINENDSVATDEIRFGDNDTLAALVANLVEADKLIILTDQDGLFSKDPRVDETATLIAMAKANDPSLLDMAGGSTTQLGRGGMITKIKAANIAARSGASTIITNGRIDHSLQRIFAGEQLGTLLTPDENPIAARKRWLAGQLEPKGIVVLDPGAVSVLTKQGKSLLAVGVKAISGSFSRGELVSCTDELGREIARGLINYSQADAEKIIGCPSEEFQQRLGYQGDSELIHRDNLVLV